MIQAQYDAALENPPWELNDYDIDDRPKKKRRVTERFYYELVTADGVRVELPPEAPPEQPPSKSREQPSQRSSQSSSSGASTSSDIISASSRRSSRRHGSLGKYNSKIESSNQSSENGNPPNQTVPSMRDKPIILPPRRNSKCHSARAPKVPLAKRNSVNDLHKPPSKSQTARSRKTSLAQSDSLGHFSKPSPKGQPARGQNDHLTQETPKQEPIKVSGKSPLARARVLRACDRCRVRKIRCGEIRPCCGSCSKAGFECITTENPKRSAQCKEEIKTQQEEVSSVMEMDLDPESFNAEEKASQQLLQESSEYSSQYSSENRQLTDDIDVADNEPNSTRRSLKATSPSSLTKEDSSINIKIRSESSLSNSLSRESSLRSTIQASIANQQLLPTHLQNIDQRASSQASTITDSVTETRSSSHQPNRPRADSLPPQITKQSSITRRSSRRNTTAFETQNNQLPSTTNIENASTASSATPSISSSDCGSNNKRNLSSEVSSITTASESEEPATQSSQSSSRTLPNLKGKDLFDSVIWSDPFSTSIFYMFISNFRRRINNDVKFTTTTHQFIRSLRDSGRLVRNYTQNIDCLEEREGLSTDLELGAGDRTRFQAKVQGKSLPAGEEGRGKDATLATGVECVLLHGSLRKLRCGVCSKLTSWDEEDREAITMAGSAPDCPSCISSSLSRQDKGRRGLAVGRLRPDIVLYGEEHPHANLVGPLIIHDLKLGPDVLLILGTSLRVHGLKIMVKEFAQAVHARGGSVIFVNQTKPPESQWGDVIDYWVEWDCDAWVSDLKERRNDIWQPYSNVTQSVASKDPVPAKQRNPSDKIPPYRPQCKRDDKTNAVHFTFKILDDLRKLKDADGNGSVRPMYWQPFERKPFRASTGQIQEEKPVESSRPSILPIRKSRKSLPNSDSTAAPTTKAPPAATSSKSEKPAIIPESTPVVNTPSIETTRGAWLGECILKNVRKLTNNTIPQSSFDALIARVPLDHLATTVPGNTIGYKRSFGDLGVEGGMEVTGLPNMRGLMDSSINIKGMSLSSLLPAGSPETMRKDKEREKWNGRMVEREYGERERDGSPMNLDRGTIVVEQRPVVKHGYGTRSKRNSRVIGVDEGVAGGAGGEGEGDPIVVGGAERMSIVAVCNGG